MENRQYIGCLGPPLMVIKEKMVNNLPVLSLSGKLDIFSKNALKDVADRYIESGAKGLILDLEGITFIDSVGIGILTLVAQMFQKLKGRVLVVNPQDQVQSMLKEINLDKLIPMYKTDAEFSQFSEI